MGHGYPVAGGLSQSAVNDKAGARTPLALVFASITLALCLLFLTGLLENLPKAVLAAVVLTAVYGLLDFPALLRMWRVSRLDFFAAAIALVGVLLLGILAGHPACRAGLHIVAARPGVAPARCVSWPRARHQQLFRPGPPSRERAAAWRDRLPSRSVADLRQCRCCPGIGLEPPSRGRSSVIRLAVCDLSAAPYLDLAGSRMLHELHAELASRGIALAHRRRPWSGARSCCGPRGWRKKSVGSTVPRRSTACCAPRRGARGCSPGGRCRPQRRNRRSRTQRFTDSSIALSPVGPA